MEISDKMKEESNDSIRRSKHFTETLIFKTTPSKKKIIKSLQEELGFEYYSEVIRYLINKNKLETKENKEKTQSKELFL
jgi:hypothetical protein